MITPAKRVNIVSLEIVKESSLLYGPRQCTSVEAAYKLVSPLIKNKDRDFTKRLQESGKLIGIELMDHLIVGPNDTFYKP